MTKDVLWTVLAALAVVALAVIGIFASTPRRTLRVIAVVVGVIALALTFGLAYNDAEFKRGLREDVADARRTSQLVLDARSSNPTAERRLLKSLALDWADRAETFLKDVESRKASVALLIATATQANFSGVLRSDLARCESTRADAKSLRDKILAHIPEARDASATASYTASECVAALPTVINDLKGTALRLPD
jgi:hypothetical protein